jgi:hypothetical protein
LRYKALLIELINTLNYKQTKNQNTKAMKTITAQKNFILQIILLITLAITISLSASAAKQDRSVKNFSKIEISGAFDVTMTQGTVEKLSIDADDKVLNKIITEVKGGTLIIRMENNNFSHNDIRAELTFINLDGIEISGAVKITGTNHMKFTGLDINGSGASKLNLDFTATKLDCDFSGASNVTLKGNTSDLDADLSGASDLDAEGLKAVNCTLECSGASKASVFATASLKVEGSGATQVSYAGNPTNLDTDMSGASKLNKI